jgi:hypothetical protein
MKGKIRRRNVYFPTSTPVIFPLTPLAAAAKYNTV